MRAFQPLLQARDFYVEVEPGILVPGHLEQARIRRGFIHGFGTSAAWRLSLELIRSGDTVFDVGANIGIWALKAACRAGPNGNVHAFEPVEGTLSQLRDHLELNGYQRVRCEPLALADREGSAQIYEGPPGDSGKNRLAPREGLRAGPQVAVTTLDRYCEQNEIERVDFIKLDVEGAEKLVFEGGRRTLGADDGPVVMFESAAVLAESMGSSCAAAKQVLAELGYGIYLYDGERLRPVEIEASHREEDLFAIKPLHALHRPRLGVLFEA
jgi:FkbM family methyltransferase